VKNKLAMETPNVRSEKTIAVFFACFWLTANKQKKPANIGSQINKSGNVM
jgi:hypothetical protein